MGLTSAAMGTYVHGQVNSVIFMVRLNVFVKYLQNFTFKVHLSRAIAYAVLLERMRNRIFE